MAPQTDTRPSVKREIFVRDHLAGYRTELANRRTFLSYLRTALAFFAGGLAFIKFSGHPIIAVIGWIILPVGVLIFFQGIFTYIHVKRAVRAEREKTDTAEQAEA